MSTDGATMKILHVLDHSLPLHSGYTFRSQNLFDAQKTMGVSPVVVTSPKHEESAGPPEQPVETINGITYFRSGKVSGPSLPLVAEFRLMRRLYRQILKVAAREMPDLIHAHSPVLNGFPALWAGRQLNLPVVYEIRAFWEDAAVDHGTYKENSWKYRLTRWLETRVCTKAGHVFVLCNGIKSDLADRGIPEEKVTPVFNGIHPEHLRPVPVDETLSEAWGLKGKKVVGFIGSFYHYEGLDLLIRAFAGTAGSDPDWRLLLVGGGEMKKRLEQVTESLGIGDQVVMPGRVPHGKIAGVYAMVDILAYPRYAMRLTELVTPLKPLEAMAMGKALIASDVGGHRELIAHEKTGLLFRAGSLESLESTLSMMMADSGLRKRLGQQGHEWVLQHHTWDRTTAVYKPAYRRLGIRP